MFSWTTHFIHGAKSVSSKKHPGTTVKKISHCCITVSHSFCTSLYFLSNSGTICCGASHVTDSPGWITSVVVFMICHFGKKKSYKCKCVTQKCECAWELCTYWKKTLLISVLIGDLCSDWLIYALIDVTELRDVILKTRI